MVNRTISPIFSSLRRCGLLCVISTLEGLGVFLWLLSQHSDPGNAIFLGYSWERLVLMAVVLFITLAIYFSLCSLTVRRQLDGWLNKTLLKPWGVVFSYTLSAFPLFAGGWLFYQTVMDTGLFRPILPTLLPVSLWLILFSAQVIRILSWNTSTRLTMNRLFSSISNALNGQGRFWLLISVLPALVILGFLFFFLLYGQPNGDEGWYLYASRLVYHGQTLYQDFAYTQMPLLPYIYGIPQLIYPSFLVGRLTTVFFFLLTVMMSCEISRRFAGRAGIFWVLLLFASYTTGLFTGVVVKTYTLTAFFIVGTFFWLSSPPGNRFRLPLAALFAICVPLVRLSGLGFAVPMLLYLILLAGHRVRGFIIGITLAGCLFTLLFFFPDPALPVWNLIQYHVDVGQLSGWDLVAQRFSAWKPTALSFKYYFIPLITGSIFTLFALKRDHSLHSPGVMVIWFAASIFGFVASNLAGGRFQTEYFFPAILSLFPILVITAAGLARWYSWGLIAQGAAILSLIAASLTAYHNEGLNYALFYSKMCNGCKPVSDIHEVSQALRQYSSKADRIFVMEYLFAVVDADRKTFPELSMANFSLSDLPDGEAERYHLVTWPIVEELIEKEKPKALLLSDNELMILNSDSLTRRVILEDYKLVLHKSYFGQKARPMFLFIHR